MIKHITTDDVPDYIKMDHAEYAKMRNEHADAIQEEMKRRQVDPVQYASSLLHTIGVWAPEFGSHHHTCIILSDMLADVSKKTF